MLLYIVDVEAIRTTSEHGASAITTVCGRAVRILF